MLSIAGYTVSSLVTEFFALDGGAMFGSVPRVIWERMAPPDEQNRIRLCSRSLLISGHGREILVDLGCGLDWEEKFKRQFAIQPAISASLSTLLPGITDVVLTHLHFDHAGGLLEPLYEGGSKLAFPGARYYFSRENWERAQSPGVRERASYVSKIVEALHGMNVELLSDNAEPFPGLCVHLSFGHTKGLAWMTLSDEHTTLAFPSDLIPTSNHIHLPFVMGYDLHAETTMQEKETFLSRAVAENWVVVFEHDRETSAGRIRINEHGRYELSESVHLDRTF